MLFYYRATGEEYKVLAENLLNKANGEFESIRGESVRQVALEVVNSSWVLDNWGVDDEDIKEIQIDEKIYKNLFMISQDVDLVDVKLKWTGMFHAVKWNGKIYVVEDNFDVTNEFNAKSTFVHELTHIFQENYSLPTKTTFDGSKALGSLKEGDATLMADTFKNNGIVPAPNEITLPSSSRLPETINKINRFVYRYGVEFVKALYYHDNGGWTTISQVYDNPPNTTEQIMHPEKYFEQESSIYINTILVSEDWNLIRTDCFGEYFIFVMLENWISKEASSLAAEGWGNDLFNYYTKGDDFLFTWDIVWDSSEDANEFYNTFKDMMEKTSADNITNNCWFGNQRYLSILLKENSILIKNASNQELV